MVLAFGRSEQLHLVLSVKYFLGAILYIYIYKVYIIKYPEKVNAFFQTLTCMLNSETDVEIHCLLLNQISKRYEKDVKYGHSSH